MSPAFPANWARAQRRENGPFRVSFASARNDVQSEVGRMQASNLRIDVDIPLRRDGLPYADFKQPEDPGVVVYWTKGGVQFAIACDRYRDAASNMRAIALTLKAKRDIQRWGATTEKAEYEGFKALPPPTGAPGDYQAMEEVVPPHVVLGVHERASKNEIKAAYREKVLSAHPDKGGTADQLRKVTEAYQALIAGASS